MSPEITPQHPLDVEGLFEDLEMNKDIEKTLRHRRAFLETEYRLTGKNRFRSFFHDLDKVFLFAVGLSRPTVRRIHRWHSSHHVEGIIGRDYLSMVVDWECASLTKPDKPLNARGTLERYYPSLQEEITPLLEELGL